MMKEELERFKRDQEMMDIGFNTAYWTILLENDFPLSLDSFSRYGVNRGFSAIQERDEKIKKMGVIEFLEEFVQEWDADGVRDLLALYDVKNRLAGLKRELEAI